MPIWLAERNEISQGAKLLYGRLLLYIGENLYCYPSQNKLSADLGVSVRMINRYIAELKKYNLVEVEQKGHDKTAKYYILEHEWESHYRASNNVY